jgi:hypothetical protein
MREYQSFVELKSELEKMRERIARVRGKVKCALNWLDIHKHPGKKHHACFEALDAFMREFPEEET